MSKLALTLLTSIATAAAGGAPLCNAVAQVPAQSEQDRKDYEAYEAALREVNAEAERRSQARAYAEQEPARPAPQVTTITPARSLAMLGSTAPMYAASQGAVASQPSAVRAAPAALAAYSPPTVATRATALASNDGAPTGCSLFEPGSASVTTEKCMQCHALSRTHPVDLDYAATIQKNPPDMYRPLAEVVRRGVLLPNGQIACVTCHDANSPWQDRIALPPGSQARPAVDPRNRDTYASPQVQLVAATLPAHSAVTPTPLCQACHTYGD